MLTTKNAKAYAVLAIIIDKRVDYDPQTTIEPYLNGRESGFAITNYNNTGNIRKAAFSENRNSDQIVVYTGLVQDFDSGGNVPTDKVYSDSKMYFSPDQYLKAAEYVINYLFKE